MDQTWLFYPEKEEAPALAPIADALCNRCPVQPSCAAWALLEADAYYGRAATFSPGDRRRYRKRWGLHVPNHSIEAALEEIHTRRPRAASTLQWTTSVVTADP